MEILHATIQDMPEIFRLYGLARDFQKAKKTVVVWPDFPESLVQNDIEEKRQFKILIDGKIACVFNITFEDPEIWQEKNADKAVYIHRIATNPDFRGQNFAKIIADWGIEFAKKNNLDFVRQDTIGENHGLIKIYTSAGFQFLGMHNVVEPEKLPSHYQQGLQVALFEINLENYGRI